MIRYKLLERHYLNDQTEGKYFEENLRPTIRVVLQTEIQNKEFEEEIKSSAYYLPGDHLAVYPENSQSLVNAIIHRLANDQADQRFVIKIKSIQSPDHPNHHPEGNIFGAAPKEEEIKWILHERLPAPVSLREALIRYLDITTPPTQQFLTILAEYASNPKEQERMRHLAKDSASYEKWKAKFYPNLLEVKTNVFTFENLQFIFRF